MRGHGGLLGQVAVPKDLDVRLRVLEDALLDERLRGHLGARVEALLERRDVDRGRGGAMRPDRHRVLRVLAAQLAQAHVDRVLAALEARAHLVRARAGLLALDPAAGIAALAGTQAASDPLAVLARLRGLQVREVQFHKAIARSQLARDGGPF